MAKENLEEDLVFNRTTVLVRKAFQNWANTANLEIYNDREIASAIRRAGYEVGDVVNYKIVIEKKK